MLLAFMATAQADGVSYIGLCNPTWNCEKTMYTWRDNPIVVGWLEQSFGNRCQCANRILQSTNPKTVRIHLTNSPCLRNNRCERHDAFYGYTIAGANKAVHDPRSRLRNKFRRTVMRVANRLKRSRGKLTCYVSPCLECDLDGRARKVLLDIVSRTLPGCVLVDNPLKDKCLAGYTCEKHGTDTAIPSPCVYDLDGTEAMEQAYFNSLSRKVRHCDLRFYWELWMNCNREGGAFVPPSLRQCNSSVYKMMKAGGITWK